MYRPTGGPDRGGYRPPSREQLAAQQRKTLRRVGLVGVGIGAVAFVSGAALGIDVIGHTIGQPTVAQEIFPQMTVDYQTGLANVLMISGGVIGLAGGGLTYANQEPSRY